MIEFATLAAALLAQSHSLLPSWFPAGKWRGHEFVVGNLAGDPGESLSINGNTGAWGDFAAGEKGGDLISLYAAKHGIKQGEAAKRLDPGGLPSQPKAQRKERRVITPVPENAPVCRCRHRKYKEPVRIWTYRDGEGRLLGYVARYDPPGIRKQFVPWTWADGQWGAGGWPEPHPLYGLDDLAKRTAEPVLVVEGEKAADAARKLAAHYVVITWPFGAGGWKKADWKQLAGREVLLWPDADDPGVTCMWSIGNELLKICRQVKLISPDDHSDGWDAADALEEGWTWDRFKDWARLHVKTLDEGAPSPVSTPAKISSKPTPEAKRPVSTVGRWMEWGLLGPTNSSNGAPFSDLNNAVRVLEMDPLLKGKIWFDEFLQRIMTIGNPHPREWRDVDDIDLTLFFQREIGLKKISTAIVSQAVMQMAFRDVRNCVKDWLEKLVWDKEPRIDHFFEDHFGAAGTPYSRAAAKNFWLSLVARAYRPGCKVDNMIVLEGGQGIGKSRALQLIGGDWFAEQHERATDNKSFGEVLQGKWIVEISEMDAFSRAEVTSVKGVVSNASDRFRRAYGRYADDYPRRCIFVGTTNKDDWNRDETGARRFWPIRCGEIDGASIASLREQFCAEAATRFKAGESWWEMPEDETREQQDERYDADLWLEPISVFLGLRQSVTVNEIISDCLQMKSAEVKGTEGHRIGRCLRALGWANKPERSGKLLRKVWRPA